MIDCTNTGSLFELGFGLSAVLAVVGESAASARRRFVTRMADSIRSKHPTLREESLSGEQFEELVFSGFRRLRFLFQFSVAVRALALLMILVSVGTLVETAVWGSKCKMSEADLYTYVLFAFAIGPFTYWGYSRYVEYVIGFAIRKRAPKIAAPLLGLIASHRETTDALFASVDSVLKEADKLLKESSSTVAGTGDGKAGA